MTENEVKEFIIVPPYTERARYGAVKTQMETFLRDRFDGLEFKVSVFAPVSDEKEFCVVPIMSYIGDDGRGQMCDQPKRWLLSRITDACREFMLDDALCQTVKLRVVH